MCGRPGDGRTIYAIISMVSISSWWGIGEVDCVASKLVSPKFNVSSGNFGFQADAV